MPARSAPAGATTASNLPVGPVRDRPGTCLGTSAEGRIRLRRRRPPSRRARAGWRGCRRSRARARVRALLPAARRSAAWRKRRGLAEADASLRSIHDEGAHRQVPRRSVRLAATDVGAVPVAPLEPATTGGSSCRGRSVGATTSTSPRSRAGWASGTRVSAPGCLAARLRSHPSNLIRVMPAKGVRWFHAASRSQAPTPAEEPGSRPT